MCTCRLLSSKVDRPRSVKRRSVLHNDDGSHGGAELERQVLMVMGYDDITELLERREVPQSRQQKPQGWTCLLLPRLCTSNSQFKQVMCKQSADCIGIQRD